MVALSDNIEGPYISNPRNPIITSRHLSYDNWVNSTGHGDIIQLDDGRNYMVLLGIRNEIERGSNMGRETFIAPVSKNPLPKNCVSAICARDLSLNHITHNEGYREKILLEQ